MSPSASPTNGPSLPTDERVSLQETTTSASFSKRPLSPASAAAHHPDSKTQSKPSERERVFTAGDTPPAAPLQDAGPQEHLSTAERARTPDLGPPKGMFSSGQLRPRSPPQQHRQQTSYPVPILARSGALTHSEWLKQTGISPQRTAAADATQLLNSANPVWGPMEPPERKERILGAVGKEEGVKTGLGRKKYDWIMPPAKQQQKEYRPRQSALPAPQPQVDARRTTAATPTGMQASPGLPQQLASGALSTLAPTHPAPVEAALAAKLDSAVQAQAGLIYEQGHDQGHTMGFNAGQIDGYKKGFKAGQAAATFDNAEMLAYHQRYMQWLSFGTRDRRMILRRWMRLLRRRGRR